MVHKATFDFSMPYPYPADLQNIKARIVSARQGYLVTHKRYQRGEVSSVYLDSAIAHLMRLQDDYIKMLELRVERVKAGDGRAANGRRRVDRHSTMEGV